MEVTRGSFWQFPEPMDDEDSNANSHLLEALVEGLDFILLALLESLALAARSEASNICLGSIHSCEAECGCKNSGRECCSHLCKGSLLLSLAHHLPAACGPCGSKGCLLDLQNDNFMPPRRLAYRLPHSFFQRSQNKGHQNVDPQDV